MSEEIDLNTNNLCTTEDAFEQFQACSMYEEDEFITLSDIVSPPPQAPDLSIELNDIPYENEVVLESQLEDQVPEVNSTIEIGLEDTEKLETLPPPLIEQNPEGHSEIASEIKPKRGRRPKTQQSDSILTVNQHHNEQINNKQRDLTPNNIPTKSTPQSNNRRGRKRNGQTSTRRKTTSRKSLVGTEEASDNTELQPSSYLSSPPMSSSVSENENASVERIPRRRPGRPRKKQILNEEMPKEEETKTVDTELHGNESKTNDLHVTNNTNKITPKRGRRKRQEHENNVNDKSDKSNLKPQEPETTFDDKSFDQCPTEVEQPSAGDQVPVKSPKKRKKSKKIQDDTMTKDHQDITTTMSEEDDMNDDICLSKLKETLDPNDTLNIDKNVKNEGETIEMILEEIAATEPLSAENNAELQAMSDVNTDIVENDKELLTNSNDINNSIEHNVDVQDANVQDVNVQDLNVQDVNVQDVNVSNEDVIDSLLVEDTSKRPTRVKARKTFNYDDGSDEDPFANVESSDDEPKRGKKGRKYYSDDEYVPGAGKRGNVSSSDISDSDIDAEVDELMMSQRRKKQRLDTSLGKSPNKRGRKPKSEKEGNGNSSLEIKTIAPNESQKQDDDIEICLQSSLIKADEDSKKKLGWGATNEFENFLAKRIQGTDIKIKKASSVQPLEIPVLDPKDAHKTIETGMQTTQITTNSIEVQTAAPYDIPMKDNVSLTPEQAENACEFLKGIVKTTAELGELMTQKSEDFIKKKINTSHITDTFKMDYCVRKSFLLFKLAKHNLMQMEEDLSKQYDEFLNKNDLMKHREKPKVLAPVKKPDDGDSDCEIIDAPTPITTAQKPKKGNVKPKFNPKTVFLNKELSIKIAKKPSEIKQEKKLQIKGRHTVWISDSVMVKKVKPTQSFLAQDSRNKKPPDCVTIEMVNNFFKEYDRQQALFACAPFVTTDWLSLNKKYVCCYFFTKPDDFSSTITEIPSGSELSTSPESQVTITKDRSCHHSNVEQKKHSPRSLFSLCTQALLSHLNVSSPEPLNTTEIMNGDSVKNMRSPETLYSLCIQNLQGIMSDSETKEVVENIQNISVVSLHTLCVQKVIEIMACHQIEPEIEVNSLTHQSLDTELGLCQLNYQYDQVPGQDVQSLLSLCVRFIQNQIYSKNTTKKLKSDKLSASIIKNTPNSLKKITFKVIVNLLNCNNLIEDKNRETRVKSLSDLSFEIATKCFKDTPEHTPKECLTINCINRLTEEAYFNMEETANFTENLEYYADDDTNFYEDQVEDHDFNDFDETENAEESENWISQVEMKEFISIPNKLTETFKPTTVDKNASPIAEQVALTRIKIEPEEEHEQIVDSTIVKTEPLHNLDEMTIIPESIMSNTATTENHFSSDGTSRKDASYDVETFEAFVSSNKLMHALNHQDPDEIFSQSASRVRRQYEPDSDTENDIGMSLLVPQTYEPLFIENAKDSLMESSGDENSGAKKPVGKKKTDRRKVKTKKIEATKPEKQISLEKSSTKEIPREKQIPSNEIAVLTRKMRGKIRQEEKKIALSDSETENSTTIAKSDKESAKENNKSKQKIGKSIDDEIQCNNVDSTEQLNEQKKCNSPDPSTVRFTGFSAIDQNEVYNYQKYVKYVYDKILPSESDETQAKHDKQTNSSYFSPEEPVELLECEPTMPFIDNEDEKKSADLPSKEVAIEESPVSTQEDVCPLPYKMRDGWKCYQLDTNDAKLYCDAQIVLEKLPETFVDTYFQYQNISKTKKEDEEVNRLINLQSLNRSGLKDGRGRGRPRKIQPKDETSTKKSIEESITDSRAASPANSGHYDELSPSEDEGGNVDDQSPPTAKKDSSENTLAKSSLMNEDNESDDETLHKIKKEMPDPDANETLVKRKPGPKSKCKPAEPVDPETCMLTADKMMNRELNLLHAPIVVGDDTQEISSKGPVTRNKQKHSSKSASGSKRVKAEDDGSSSEEEKHQWFTIKEKLLKKMINKKDTTREDDAKRAKLVNEFIERRGDLAENYLKRRKGGRSRRSVKKMLERQKQFKVLSRELFGHDVPDTPHQGKGKHSSYFKGRRNIRKVLDKKSLAKGTVLANMEEFERKTRINLRQAKLRELLGCEEGVNVLVINDEVCLEYDFETHRPVVTIHPFFTKVMKAHQYEGVKFMWDACFESLESVESGFEGGGCILAHCMGLGKTLQVLALLHTVLTHPRVGMQRVLVCCPLSTVLNWVDEIHKWIGPVTDQIKVFELSKLRKTNVRAYQLEDWYKGGGIFIIGYELFRSLTTLDPYLDNVRPVIVNKIRSALLDPGPDIIICDEGHLLKNDCSVLAVAMSRVRTKRRIVLTGTPMQNNLREYYCMVNFVKPNLLGTYAEYSNRFENPIMNGQHRDSREEDIRLMKARTHILHKVLEGCLQRQEASVLYPYLPKKFEYTVFVSLSKCQWDLYKHYLQNCTSTLSNKNNVLKDFHILQKIWSHPQVLHNFQSRSSDEKSKVKIEKLEDDLAHEDLNAEDIKPSATDTWWLQYLDGGETLDSLHSSNKFVCVFRILDECIALGDKLLIFSTSLFSMDALEYFLKKIKSWSLGKEYYRLDGSVPAEVRQKWCREFNAESNINTKLFLISTRAGCLGLNMTAANRVIILDTSWNPAHDIQSIFRVYRFGQKKDCYIYRLVALGTMEQKIYERSVTKQAVACRVVDEQQIDRHYNSADLTELYKYDEAGVGVAGGVAVGVEDVVLLRVARDINLHAVHEHDSLLRGSAEQGLPEHERNAAWMQFQQEHAHKQIEDEHLQQAVKQVHGHEYAKLPTSTIVKTEQQEAAAFQTKPEKKRGPKKNIVINCSIPIDGLPPNTSSLPALDHNREEELVSKITHILIKHNFHVRQEPREIAALVSNVRRILASGRLEELNETDELSASIANLLLQNNLPTRQLDELDNIMSESVNNSIGETAASTSKEVPKPRARGRRKCKRKWGYVYEEIKPIEKKPDVEYDGRRRRRAALQAEMSFDKITDGEAVAEVADESDAEFVPDANVRMQVEMNRKEMQEEKDRIENDRVQNVTVKEEPEDDTPKLRKSQQISYEFNNKKDKTPKHDVIVNQTKILQEEMNSILLSDDDEPPPPKKRPGPARKTMKIKHQEETVKPVESNVSEKTKEKESVEPSVSVKSEAIIPLHPSLLSNQNFIKIVAHTYLTGNPMLDEDAATLAAQYSTQKALKEYESTGKDIKTGPLYDIAVQVLGIDILKKLHETKGKSPLKSTQPASEKPVETPVEPPKETETVKEIPEQPKPSPQLKTIKLKIRLPSSSSSTPIMTTSTFVVPSSSLTKLTPSSQTLITSSSAKPVTSAVPPAILPVLTPAPTSKVVPVGFYRLGVSRPVTDWSRVNINSCLERRHGYDYAYEFDSFKGAAEIPANDTHQSFDECILPDDDDIRIVSDPVSPQPAPTAQPLHLTPVPLTALPEATRRQSLQLILNNVKSGKSLSIPPETNNTLQNRTTNVNNAKTTPRIIGKRNESLPTPTSAATQVLTMDPNTISLDSDDEDCLPIVNVSGASSATPPPVVPVSLTTSNPPPQLTKNLPAPPPPVLLNNQLNSLPGASNKRYVVVPAANLKSTNPTDILAGAVPVALSKVAKVGQPSRVSVGETINIINDDVETILPVSIPRNEKRNEFQKSCKAGDIVRISKSGKIEVLNRIDKAAPPTKPIPAPAPSIKTQSAPVSIEIDDAPTASRVVTPSNKKSNELETKRKQSAPVSIEIDDAPTVSRVVTPSNKKSNELETKRKQSAPVSIEIDDAPTVSRVVTPSNKKSNELETKRKQSAPVSIEIDDAPTVSRVVTPSNKKSNELETKRKETSSTSNATRPRASSPTDPLSILRDVIHIEADDYAAPKPTIKKIVTKNPPTKNDTTATKNVTTPTKNLTNPTKNVTTSTKNLTNPTKGKAESLLIKSLAKDKATAAKLSDSAWHKSFTQKEKPRQNNQTISAQSIIDNFKASGIKLSVASAANKKGQKSSNVPKTVVAPNQVTKKLVPVKDSKRVTEKVDKTNAMDTIDITALDEAPPAATDRTRGKSKLTGSTIVGTSKDIILCGAGKAVKRTQPPPAVQAFEAIRASTSTESSAKKKKTDKPMTLKDFDIDDIDDIIELD